MGGGFLMVWGCVSYYGVCYLMFLEGEVDAKKYIKTLEDKLLPWPAMTHCEDWLYQQENAPIHTAHVVRR